jgi:hypothetical protein
MGGLLWPRSFLNKLRTMLEAIWLAIETTIIFVSPAQERFFYPLVKHGFKRTPLPPICCKKRRQIKLYFHKEMLLIWWNRE